MKPMITFTCAGLLAVSARADPVIEFYFSKMSCENLNPYSYVIPSEYASPDVLQAAPGETVYLWARTLWQNGHWVTIGLNLTSDVTGGSIKREAAYIDPPGPPPPYWTYRWSPGDLDPADETFLASAGSGTQGIGFEADYYMVWEGDPDWHGHYCLGSIQWGDPGPKWLSVSSGQVIRYGYSDSTVYFGFDESGNPELGGSGAVEGTTSVRADIIITPEPSSLLLLSVAAVFLRRR